MLGLNHESPIAFGVAFNHQITLSINHLSLCIPCCISLICVYSCHTRCISTLLGSCPEKPRVLYNVLRVLKYWLNCPFFAMLCENQNLKKIVRVSGAGQPVGDIGAAANVAFNFSQSLWVEGLHRGPDNRDLQRRGCRAAGGLWRTKCGRCAFPVPLKVRRCLVFALPTNSRFHKPPRLQLSLPTEGVGINGYRLGRRKYSFRLQEPGFNPIHTVETALNPGSI